MAVVGYLLGAGASAQCVPVVNGMGEDIHELIETISSFNPYYGRVIPTTSTDDERIDKAVEILESLADVCGNYYSIDTYAKKLYLTNRKAFQTLKLDLCLYFTLRQALNNPDKRYDNFFSSIMTSKEALPPKVKIISWNYDFQIERSFGEFIDHDSFDNLRNLLGMISPHEFDRYKDYYGKFNIMKLNGSARIETKSYKGYLFDKLISDRESLARDIIGRYLEIIETPRFNCELKFAWENANYENLFSVAQSELDQITVLVIIGYSFPFFNRDVDSRLLKMMPKLRKIYIQDLHPSDIEETMREFYDFQHSIKGYVDVVHKTNLNQFVFPKELDITS